jgi:hypothetical protein
MMKGANSKELLIRCWANFKGPIHVNNLCLAHFFEEFLRSKANYVVVDDSIGNC